MLAILSGDLFHNHEFYFGCLVKNNSVSYTQYNGTPNNDNLINDIDKLH